MADANEGHEGIPRHEGRRIYRLSTLRFIPKGDEVPKVLIHLLSHIFRRHASIVNPSLSRPVSDPLNAYQPTPKLARDIKH